MLVTVPQKQLLTAFIKYRKYREAYEIHVLEGDHVMIMDHVSIDQRTLEDGCPLTVAQDCGVELYLQGDNALFAGAGNGAISLEEDSYLDISGFGQGILSPYGISCKY